jgi:hypothetical protein
MSTLKLPASQAVLPVTDPNKVVEVYATEVIVNVRDDIAHVTFIVVRPCGIKPDGTSIDERVVTSRVVMSVSAATAFAECFGQVKAAAQLRQTLKPN